jgi:LysR family transcriptional regulator for bpeEF and oprC
MNKLLAMQLFARVVETGSFTKAAATLKVPKGTATKLLQQLEKHLHLTLVQRTTRQVAITPAGGRYYERLSPLLKELEEVELTLGQSEKGVHGTLRVDAPAAFTQVMLIPQLPAFLAKHPDLHLNLGVSDRPIDLVAKGVDCVIRGGAPSDQSLIARRVATLEYITCAAPSYISRYGIPAHPRDLEACHQFILCGNPETGQPTSATIGYFRRRERVSVTCRSVLTINEGTTHLAAGLRGLGVFRVFRFMADPYVVGGELVRVLQEWHTDRIPIYVVYPPTRHPSVRVRAFVDWVAGICARAG